MGSYGKYLKDDLYYAKIAANELGVRLHEVNVSKDDIENNLKESIWASETHKWTQVSPAVAQLFLSWEIRDKGYKVVFGGEGADEILIWIPQLSVAIGSTIFFICVLHNFILSILKKSEF